MYYNIFALVLIHGGIKLSVIQLENDAQVSVVWYGNENQLHSKASQPKWSELISRLSIPQNNINKYARGTAVYGNIADGVDDKGNEYQKYRNDDNVLIEMYLYLIMMMRKI